MEVLYLEFSIASSDYFLRMRTSLWRCLVDCLGVVSKFTRGYRDDTTIDGFVEVALAKIMAEELKRAEREFQIMKQSSSDIIDDEGESRNFGSRREGKVRPLL